MKAFLKLLAMVLLGSITFASNTAILLVSAQNYEDQKELASFETAFKQALIRHQLVVLDRSQLGSVRQGQLVNQLLRGETEAAIQLGMSHQADWLIVASLESSLVLAKEVGPITAYTYKGTANVSAISISTAQIVFSQTHEAVGLGTSRSEAISKAFAELGRNSGEKVAKVLIAQTSSAIIHLSIIVTGLNSFTDAATLLKEIKTIHGVLTAERKSYRDGTLEAIVAYKGNPDDFAAAIENLPLTKLTLLEFDGHTLNAKVQ